jgi:hypothetical protein
MKLAWWDVLLRQFQVVFEGVSDSQVRTAVKGPKPTS